MPLKYYKHIIICKPCQPPIWALKPILIFCPVLPGCKWQFSRIFSKTDIKLNEIKLGLGQIGSCRTLYDVAGPVVKACRSDWKGCGIDSQCKIFLSQKAANCRGMIKTVPVPCTLLWLDAPQQLRPQIKSALWSLLSFGVCISAYDNDMKKRFCILFLNHNGHVLQRLMKRKHIWYFTMLSYYVC